ncbi:MAG: T9SS type A sorting domain-containing protein, partial [Bacteroidota bacterium]
NGQRLTKLYSNDNGTFNEVLNTPFLGAYKPKILCSDIDNDGDEDVVIYGITVTTSETINIYTNQNGTFTESPGNPDLWITDADIALSDVDGDGDQDLMVAGGNYAKLFLNENGTFTEDNVNDFPGANKNDVAFADIDGDGDEDLLISGLPKLYRNQDGIFTEIPDQPFQSASRVAFADLDNDGDPDIIATDTYFTGYAGLRFYVNEGGGDYGFSLVSNARYEGTDEGNISVADVNSDGNLDFIINGFNLENYPTTILYLNNGLPIATSLENRTEVAEDRFTVFPNPAKDQLQIEINLETASTITIRLFNLTGQLVNQANLEAPSGITQFPMDIQSLPKGTYFIQLDHGGHTAAKKIVVL